MRKSGMLWVGLALVVFGFSGMVLNMAYLRPGESRGSRASAGMDAMFIEQMIPHHQDAVAMAQLALPRAGHPEIERLAEDVIKAQTIEIDQMREW